MTRPGVPASCETVIKCECKNVLTSGDGVLANLELSGAHARGARLALASCGSPMIRVFSVIQMPHASDEGSVTFRFGPIDCFFLSLKTELDSGPH